MMIDLNTDSEQMIEISKPIQKTQTTHWPKQKQKLETQFLASYLQIFNFQPVS